MPKLTLRQSKGATLGLVATLAVTLVLIGACFFFLVRILSGDRQTVNATDAGALGAARSMLAVSIPQANVATEFRGLGVNVHTGQPDDANGVMNLFAYNRAAGATALIAMNALQENTQTAIDNANGVVTNLHAFGDALNTSLLNSGHLGNTTALSFHNISSQNNVKMMGAGSSTNLTNDLVFKSVSTGFGTGGKSNVYFHPNAFTGDAYMTSLVPTAQDTSGSVRSVAQPDPQATSYAIPPAFVHGQPLLKAYNAISFDARISDIYLAAVCPSAKPHLIDTSRFATAPDRAGFAPVNSVQGLTQTLETKSNTALTHVACALVGSLFHEYPVTLNHGYIRIRNGPDARVANPSLSGIYGSVDGSNNIFNNQLYAGPGGSGGIVLANNGVFGTLWTGIYNELSEWAAYNTSFGLDVLGHNPRLDPTRGQQFGMWYNHSDVAQVYWPYPNANVRMGGGANQLATVTDMRTVYSIIDYCNTATIQSDPICQSAMGAYQNNFGSSGTGYPLPPGQTVTNLEALKGEVITAWLQNAQTNGNNANNFFSYTYTTNGTEFTHDSGSKVYARENVGYATPSNSATICFGTVGTPGQLLDQISTNQINQGVATCAQVNQIGQWNDPNTILGRLYQRCREILPGVSAQQVAFLLYNYPLDLGQYQYIYLPPGSSTLAISQTPPAFLTGSPEHTHPGTTLPDGGALPVCKDPDFSGAIGNQVNSQAGEWGQNIMGDSYLHDMPFEAFTGSATTWDYATWKSSSGANNLLGELTFYNHVAANGQFSAPN